MKNHKKDDLQQKIAIVWCGQRPQLYEVSDMVYVKPLLRIVNMVGNTYVYPLTPTNVIMKNIIRITII